MKKMYDREEKKKWKNCRKESAVMTVLLELKQKDKKLLQ